jgi:4-hydroxymandelate oxidase
MIRSLGSARLQRTSAMPDESHRPLSAVHEDTERATIEVLPAVVDRVADRAPVLLDSGIRRGTDVLKGLGSGAPAVLIGDPILYELGVAGADGIRDVVNILRTELRVAMATTGRTRLDQIDRSIFWKS